VVYYNEAAKYVFTGDSLFAQSIGRTDLPGGDLDELMASLKNKILALPEDTVVYPGHGPSTDVATEKKTNPFLM
jgi:glyoxylase-like metal-dependent hydrolase (beta-lactamase superfamily II)